MNTLELAKVAQAYYDSLKAPSLAQGWDKYVATHGTVSMFVKSDYSPKQGEAVFFLTTRNRQTACTLYKNYQRFFLQHLDGHTWRVEDLEKGFSITFEEGRFNETQRVESPKQWPDGLTAEQAAAWASESMRAIGDYMSKYHFNTAMKS